MSTQQATVREQTQRILPQKRIVGLVARGLFWLLVLAIAFYTIAPFAYAISISFRTNAQVLISARYLPESLHLINYQNLLEDKAFMRTMLNSSLRSSR